MNKEELIQALEQNGSASSVLMKELLTVVEAEIQEASKPAKPLLVTSLFTTQEYSRHEMAMHLGITEEQLMQILRGEIAAVTDEHWTLYLTGTLASGSMISAIFGSVAGDFGYTMQFAGDTNSNTYYLLSEER